MKKTKTKFNHNGAPCSTRDKLLDALNQHPDGLFHFELDLLLKTPQPQYLIKLAERLKFQMALERHPQKLVLVRDPRRRAGMTLFRLEPRERTVS